MNLEFSPYEYETLVKCSEPNSELEININPNTGAVTAVNKTDKSIEWSFKRGVDLIEQLLVMCEIKPTKNV